MDYLAFSDIIIIGLIAAFLIYRLRSVLGQRHGEERQRPRSFSAQQPTMPKPISPSAEEDETYPRSLAASLDHFKSQDPSFDEKDFLKGAREAFRMIVTAYAEGDKETLKPLLSKNVYKGFEEAIEQRHKAGETLSTIIVSISSADIRSIRQEGKQVFMTVEFSSQQINMISGPNGEIISGNPDRPTEIIDTWTFGRDITSLDPNWILVATGTNI